MCAIISDQNFHGIADTLRRNDVETVNELMGLLGKDCTQVKGGMFNIKEWLEDHLNEPSGHTQPHHYKFTMNNNKVNVEFKGTCNQKWIKSPTSFLASVPNINSRPNLKMPSFDGNKIKTMETRNENTWRTLYRNEEETTKWWETFLYNIKRISVSSDAQKTYAHSCSQWLLPLLPKQQTRVPNPAHQELQQSLREMVANELNPPQVSINR